MSTPKQVIILRKDLNMRKGKMVAQGAHASIRAILSMSNETFNKEGYNIQPDNLVKEWLYGLNKKVCVYVNSEQELLDLYNKIKEESSMGCSLIQDAGLTEFGGVPTYTAVAIGPDYPEVIDPFTKHLPLL